MYIKFEDKEKGKRFTFFSKEREIKGEKVTHTDKSVFAILSEGIKTGENNGQPIWENDHWNAFFCGKAYEKALELKNKDRIIVMEMNIRNVYHASTHRSYPQILVTDFYIPEEQQENPMEARPQQETMDEDGFMNIQDGFDEELPYN